MKRSISLLIAHLLAVPVLALPGSASAQTGVTPGYWEITNQVVSPFPTRKVEKRCIRPADVAKFMQGPSNHIYTCTYPTRDIAGGRIRLAGSCKTRDGKPVSVTGRGAYTGDTFHVDANIQAQIGGFTLPVHARTTARRLGDDCPADPDLSRD